MKLNIVLFQPEIPQNTGNISRTCSATASALHLVHPLGFSLDERHLRRAGLDYWDGLEIAQYESTAAFLDMFKTRQDILYCFSQKAERSLWDMDFTQPAAPAGPKERNIWLAFGCESKGLAESILIEHRQSCLRIPMLEGKRSLNLSNCVAIAVYEVLRQFGFEGLKTQGQLKESLWEDHDA